MKIACGIIRDLLPLYVDGICSAESSSLLEGHLAECERCRQLREQMSAKENTYKEDSEDMKFVEGLTKLKSRIGKRTRLTIAGSVAAMIALVLMFELLFNLPLKELKPTDVQVNASVYAVGELPKLEANAEDTSVTITKGTDDEGDIFRILISELPNAEISMSENLLDNTDYITLIEWSSPYHLQEIRWETDGDGEDTLYVQAYKTTFLNNKAKGEFHTSTSMEMRRISKIVYVNDDGSETLLWQQPAQLQTDEIKP